MTELWRRWNGRNPTLADVQTESNGSAGAPEASILSDSRNEHK